MELPSGWGMAFMEKAAFGDMWGFNSQEKLEGWRGGEKSF